MYVRRTANIQKIIFQMTNGRQPRGLQYIALHLCLSAQKRILYARIQLYPLDLDRVIRKTPSKFSTDMWSNDLFSRRNQGLPTFGLSIDNTYLWIMVNFRVCMNTILIKCRVCDIKDAAFTTISWGYTIWKWMENDFLLQLPLLLLLLNQNY